MADGDDFRINRRTFVGASIAVGGAVAAGPLVAGCEKSEAPAPAAGDSTVNLRINGKPHEVTVDNRTSLLDMLRERVGPDRHQEGLRPGRVRCVHDPASTASGSTPA